MTLSLPRGTVALIFSIGILLPCAARAQSFKDLPQGHAAYEAVEFLKSTNVISGYEDGTFRPDKKVNRAEALKLIVAPLLSPEQLEIAKQAQSVYTDVPNDIWFKPYLEYARAAGIVDGPPAKTAFHGASTVLKAEFMKMTQFALGADALESFSEIRLPLSNDVANPDEWFYPYMRYGITSSMTMISAEGALNPGKELTRAETAILFYRYIMYAQGRRTQALLSEAENEILIVLDMLEKGDIAEAEYASARALLAARGAHKSKPEEDIVRGAVKTAEAFRALVRGYRAGLNKDYNETIRLSGEAWNLGAKARELAPDLSQIADQVQSIAKSMADSARAQQATP